MVSATTASTTNLWISGIASGSLLKTTTGGQVVAAVAGSDYSNFAFPFTPTSNFGVNANATGKPLLLTAGLSASTTVRFGNAGISNFIFDSSTGNLGLGTSSPFTTLSVAGVGSFDDYVRASYFKATSTSIASTFGYDIS